jgi:hypothetical protein
MNVSPSDRAVPFGTSDYPEPEPNVAAQAERDRSFNLGIEAAAVLLEDYDQWSLAEVLRDKLKREVD